MPVWSKRVDSAVCLASVLAVVIVGCSSPGQNASAPAGSTTAPAAVAIPTVLIVDASGSMTITDAPGPRIDAAKAAANGLIDALPDDAAVFGLITYGTGTGSTDAEQTAGCRDVTTLVPFGPLDKTSARSRVDGLAPRGYTPVSLALINAAAMLPTGGKQAIVLVSDGEDTCGKPPCDTAKEIKTAHPDLAISTVGFKTAGDASEQLKCVANATGGLFVVAANANQLAARLLATQDVAAAEASLSSTGSNGVELGATAATIKAAHPDFPNVASSGRAVVVWRDCDFAFTDGTLDSIAPHNGGRTIDGLAAGAPISKAVDLYGPPIEKKIEGSTGTLTYAANTQQTTAYQMYVENYAETGSNISGTIKKIILCRCVPKNRVATKPAGITDDTILNMTIPAGTCAKGEYGWKHAVPIALKDGKGEAKTSTGAFGGASITGARLVGWLDANNDGVSDAVIGFTCFGSTFAMCCAGRTSMMGFLLVVDFSSTESPKPVGATIMPGNSPLRGETYGETRRIDKTQIDGSTIITEEKLVYPESASAAELGYSPFAIVVVTHKFIDGQWTSTERLAN